MYNSARFKAGRSSLKDLELREIGGVQGKSLLHLQCHFGHDTLSWARLGATVTGADFSERAIELARSLSKDLEIPARFVLSDLYSLPDALHDTFDVVFTSYGALAWLPDIPRWGQVVAHFLKPGGTFYVADAHPFLQVFDDDDKSDLKVRYPYFQGPEPLKFEVKGSYADPDADYTGVEYGWNHTVGDYINALIDAGLRIEFFHEFPFMGWQALPFMQKGEDGLWRLPDGTDKKIPLLFSLKATKPLPLS
jgi:SAM-dependent methyltransferase